MGHKHTIKDYPAQIAGIAAVAAFVGAMTALLSTPKTGSDRRLKIRTGLADAKNKLIVQKDAKLPKALNKIQDKSLTAAKKISKAEMSTEADIKNKGQQVKSQSKEELDHIRKHGEL